MCANLRERWTGAKEKVVYVLKNVYADYYVPLFRGRDVCVRILKARMGGIMWVGHDATSMLASWSKKVQRQAPRIVVGKRLTLLEEVE